MVAGQMLAQAVRSVLVSIWSEYRRNLRSRRSVLPRLEALEARQLLDATLLRDINPWDAASLPLNPVSCGSAVYYLNTDSEHGQELWKSDGTTAGTQLLKDIFPGPGSSDISGLVNVGGRLFFVANDGVNGSELWASDGTAAGTVMAKDIYVGAGSSSPSNLFAAGSTLYFLASTSTAGRELWKSDGTSTGTLMVKDINPGSGNSTVANMAAIGSRLFFTNTTAAAGNELWSSDGTDAGTAMLKDILPGSGESAPALLTPVGSTLYFYAMGSTAVGRELWKSDGTAAGTVLVKDINPGVSASNLHDLVNVNGTLYLSATDNNTGRELWKSDGTEAGTVMVKDAIPGFGSPHPYNLVAHNGSVYYVARDAGSGLCLWKSNGTEAGTVVIKSVFTGGTGSNPNYLTKLNGKVYFAADDGFNGIELWVSDGTLAGTRMVKDICPGAEQAHVSNLANFKGAVYLTAYGVGAGTELWKSDGTAAGTVMVKDIRPGSGNSAPRGAVVVGDTLFLLADDGTNGLELWKSDGTADGTVLVRNITSGASSSTIYTMVAAGNRLFFTLNDAATGTELWISDGTEAGTYLLKDIYAGSGSSNPSNLIARGDTVLFFSANNGSIGQELWRSDGTVAGTWLVKDIRNGYPNSTPSFLAEVNGIIYFSAGENTNGQELWRSDGSEAGTYLVKNINAGAANSNPSYLANVNGTLFFSADDGINGAELWKSDGTAAGTVLVKNIYPGIASSSISSTIAVGDRLYFLATDGVGGVELWISDGTTAGTILVEDVWKGAPSSAIGNMVALGDKLLFAAGDGEHGRELWMAEAPLTALAASINGPTLPRPQEAAAWTFTASGPMQGTITWTIDWGDSSTPQTASGTSVTLSHSYSGTSGVYSILATASDGQASATSSQLIALRASATGSITREVWNNLPAGTALGALLESPLYPDSPSSSGTLTSLEAPINVANTYGQRLCGYLIPPASGEYFFWLAADDEAMLSLSSDDDPANLRMLAATRWTARNEWDKFATQQSLPVYLEAGKRYYIEAVQYDNAGTDHLSVAWAGPGLSRDIIAGQYLEPYGLPKTPSDLTASVTTSGQVSLQWNDNANDETGYVLERAADAEFTENLVRYSLPANSNGYLDTNVLSNHTYYYRLCAFNLMGSSQVVASDAVTTPVAGTEVIWFDDALPPGSTPYAYDDAWTWISASPSPISGSLAHQSSIGAGMHQHYFENASTISARGGDSLFAYVYLDPANIPSEVMLQFRVGGSWEHRAFWGADNVPYGIPDTESHYYMGDLPAAGGWVRLEVPAEVVGVAGANINGMAFTLNGGRATWDKAGVLRFSPTAPALSALVAATRVDLSWQAHGNEDGFVIERAADAAFTQQVQHWELGAGVSGFRDNTVSGSTTYYYRIRAFNDLGSSAWAAYEPVTTRQSNTVTWDGSSDGDGDGVSWNDPQNWAGDAIPRSADDVVIGNGAQAINYGSSAHIINSLALSRSLSLAAGHLQVLESSNIEAAGTLNITGGYFHSAGTITVVGSLELSGGTLKFDQTLALQGSTTIMAGAIEGQGTGTISNSGTLEFAGGSHTISYSVTNIGVIEVSGGNISFTGTITNGTNAVLRAAGGDIYIDESATLQNGGSIVARASSRILFVSEWYGITHALFGKVVPLSGSEFATVWRGLSGTTCNLEVSTDGVDFSSVGEAPAAATRLVISGMERAQTYWLRASAIDSGHGGGLFVYESGPITTLDKPVNPHKRVLKRFVGFLDGKLTNDFGPPVEVWADSDIAALLKAFSTGQLNNSFNPYDLFLPSANYQLYADYENGEYFGHYTFDPNYPYGSEYGYMNADPSAQQSLSGPFYYWLPVTPIIESDEQPPSDCDDPCKCVDNAGGTGDSGPGPGGNGPMGVGPMGMSGPLVLGSGKVQLNTNLLSSDSGIQVNASWASTGGSYSNGLDPSGASASYGSGMATGGLPFAVQYGGISVSGNRAVQVVNSLGNTDTFMRAGDDQQSSYLLEGEGSGAAMQFAYATAKGKYTVFNDFTADVAPELRGKFVSRRDADGNESYVLSRNAAGEVTELRHRAAGQSEDSESWLYEYLPAGNPNAGKIASITVRRPNGSGGWTNVSRISYSYYGNGESNGLLGDQKTIVTEQYNQGQWQTLETRYYRWYLDTATRPDGTVIGFAHGLKYFFDTAEYKQLQQWTADHSTTIDSITDATTMVMSNGLTHGVLHAFATDYFEYDDRRRCTLHASQTTGCSGTCGGVGENKYEYFTNPNPVSDYQTNPNAWYTRTIETLNDGNVNIVYCNYKGQAILKLFWNVNDPVTPSLQGKTWGTFLKYDSSGRVIWEAKPSALNLPLTATTDLSNLKSQLASTLEGHADLLYANANGNYEYLKDNAGKIEVVDYYSDTTATDQTAGGVVDYIQRRSVRQGELGQDVPFLQFDYYQKTSSDQSRVVVAHRTEYTQAGSGGAQQTTYLYEWAQDGVGIRSKQIIAPAVSAAHNGSGQANVSKSWYDENGREIWRQDADGYLHYTAYDAATGAVIKTITDVNTAQLTAAELATLPQGCATPAGGGLHLVSLYEVDQQGRTVKATDPAGRVTYTVYNDAQDEVRTYRGWNSATHAPTGPIEIFRRDEAHGYSEYLTISVAATVDQNGRPTGQETFTAANILSLSRTILNEGGQVVETDAYSSLQGVTYSTSSLRLGTAGVNYLPTLYGYEKRGRQARSVDPDGTVLHLFYDGQGNLRQVWQGTDDVPTGDYLADGILDWRDFRKYVQQYGVAPAGTNLVKVLENVYDDGMVGDGNLVQSIQYAAEDDTSITNYHYDWQNRLTDTAGPDGLVEKYTYDNLGQVTLVQRYVDADGDWVIDADELRGQSASLYDEQGRVYRSTVWAVSSAGVLGNSLSTNYWYNGRGFLVKSADANGLFSKSSYDGAGRLLASRISFDPDESTYAEAVDSAADGDIVLEKTRRYYDGSGNVIAQVNYQRHDDGLSGSYALTAANSYASSIVNWYDLAGRQTHSATVGHESGSGTRYVFAANGTLIDANGDNIPDIAQGTPLEPNTSNDYIVSKVEYDVAGNPFRRIDNAGRITQSAYDLLGRTTRTVENYVNGVVTETEASDTDRTTEYVYDAKGRLSIQRALSPQGSGNGVQAQETRYLYEDELNGSLVTNTIYPDSADTTSAGTDQVKFSYDQLGRKLSSTDQRGVTHLYVYDSAGRLRIDYAVNLPADVDGSVRRIEYSYDDQGRVQSVTSFDEVYGNGIVSQIVYSYDGWGNVIKSQQEHQGAVTASTPAVQYAYEDGAVASEAKFVRLASVTYPDGRVIDYDYESNSAARLYEIKDGSSILARYRYLGSGTIVKVEHPAVSGGLNLSYGTAADGYSGLDRFGQITNQRWSKDNGTLVDGYSYAYDRGGNRMTKDNLLNSGLSEDYSYDGLNRLISASRAGTLLPGQWLEGGVDGSMNSSVAISGDWAVLGNSSYDWVPNEEEPWFRLEDAGTAFLYHRTQNGWEAAGQVMASNISSNSQFGDAVAIDGDVMIVGAHYAGAAYIYRLVEGQWVQEVTLTGAYEFGLYVAVKDNRAMVVSSAGAYVYEYANGTWTQSDVLAGAYGAISLEDDTAVIGDKVYERSGGQWQQTATLAAGGSVAIQDGRIAVCGPQVTVYEKIEGTWQQTGQITPPAMGIVRQVALGEDRLLVLMDDMNYWTADAVYVYGRSESGWELLGTQDATMTYPWGGPILAADGEYGVSPLNGGIHLFDTNLHHTMDQSWNLDALGNWSGFSNDGTGQSRQFNAANEITGISGTWIDPVYDAAGNMTSGPKAGDESTRLHYVYDAWNRMTAVKADNNGQPGTVITSYAYDGEGRRIAKIVGSDRYDSYYNQGYQAIEVRKNSDSDAYEQYVFDQRYVDAPICRYYDADTDGVIETTSGLLFATSDANFNVTGLVDAATGGIAERYIYTPYGERTALDASFIERGTSSFDFIVGHQGLFMDIETGMYYNRARYLHTSMGTFTIRDPLEYVDGGSLYEYVGGIPVFLNDPFGLCECTPPLPGYPNEYHKKVIGIFRTQEDITPSQQSAPEKWISGANQIELIKSIGSILKSISQGGYKGGPIGSGQQLAKDQLKAILKKKLKGIAQQGIDTSEGQLNGVIDKFLNGLQEHYGYSLWIGYEYDECVVDKMVNGQPVGHFEKRGPKYVPYTQTNGSKQGNVFGGNPGLGYPDIDWTQLLDSILDVEHG